MLYVVIFLKSKGTGPGMPHIPKSEDAQIPSKKWCSYLHTTCTDRKEPSLLCHLEIPKNLQWDVNALSRVITRCYLQNGGMGKK